MKVFYFYLSSHMDEGGDSTYNQSKFLAPTGTQELFTGSCFIWTSYLPLNLLNQASSVNMYVHTTTWTTWGST